MKKTKLYPVILVLFAIATGFIALTFKNHQKDKAARIYTLIDRKGQGAAGDEWLLMKKRAAAMLQSIKNNPQDTKPKLALAALFIQEARITGNYMYYDMAALKYVNEVLAADSANVEGLTLKAVLLLSQHHFAEGLEVAQQAQRINPYNAFVYGILVDGSVEMGKYAAAIDYSDKMVSIRPDIRSYSRISYLREIHGDLTGAIDAMKMAVDAGAPGDEATEWCRVQVGKLYEQLGDSKNAAMHYTISLQSRPQYVHAIAGLARLAMANKEYALAEKLYSQADSLSDGFSFKEDMVDLYRLTGNREKAEELSETVIAKMTMDARSGEDDASIGHYSDQELAYAYLKLNAFDRALFHAQQEYNRRPENIDVNETLAWVYYNKADYAKALPYMKTALRTNSKNPRLLCRAGLLYLQNGDRLMAKSLLSGGLKNNGAMDEPLKTASRKALTTL